MVQFRSNPNFCSALKTKHFEIPTNCNLGTPVLTFKYTCTGFLVRKVYCGVYFNIWYFHSCEGVDEVIHSQFHQKSQGWTFI